MSNVYEVISEIKGFMKNTESLVALGNYQNNDSHIVETDENRGGFEHFPYVPCSNGKARLLLNTRDNKVWNNDKNSFGHTSQVIAEYNPETETFEFVNHKFLAMLSKEVYSKLVSFGACEPNQKLNKLIEIDFSQMNLFPEPTNHEQYKVSKLSLIGAMKAKKELNAIKTAARKWFKNNEQTDFEGFEPFITRNVSETPKKRIETPYIAYEVIPEIEVSANVNKNAFRIETMNGKRKSVSYTPELYNKLINEIEVMNNIIDKLKVSVRLFELGMLEYNVTIPGFNKMITNEIEVTYATLTNEEIKEPELVQA